MLVSVNVMGLDSLEPVMPEAVSHARDKKSKEKSKKTEKPRKSEKKEDKKSKKKEEKSKKSKKKDSGSDVFSAFGLQSVDDLLGPVGDSPVLSERVR